jgi:hypothetical protein
MMFPQEWCRQMHTIWYRRPGFLKIRILNVRKREADPAMPGTVVFPLSYLAEGSIRCTPPDENRGFDGLMQEQMASPVSKVFGTDNIRTLRTMNNPGCGKVHRMKKSYNCGENT